MLTKLMVELKDRDCTAKDMNTFGKSAVSLIGFKLWLSLMKRFGRMVIKQILSVGTDVFLTLIKQSRLFVVTLIT